MGSSPPASTPRWLRLQAAWCAVPLAGFLVLHLLAQATALGGPWTYERAARAIRSLPGFVGLELIFIYVPLAVHASAGVYRWLRARGRQSGALLERLSGAALLVFLLFHVWQFRVRRWLGELDLSDYFQELASSLSSTVAGGVPVVAVAYLAGLAAAAAHAGLGLRRWLWRDEAGAASDQRWAACCSWALGLGVFGLGTLIVVDLATGSVLIHLP